MKSARESLNKGQVRERELNEISDNGLKFARDIKRERERDRENVIQIGERKESRDRKGERDECKIGREREKESYRQERERQLERLGEKE